MKTLDRRKFLKQSAIVMAASIAGRAVGRAPLVSRNFSAQGLDHPFFAGAQKPDVIAHRGGNGHWPGETMFAMRRAVEVGVDVLEMDVFLTASGTDDLGRFEAPELVLMHDEDVGMTTEGNRRVYEYKLHEITELHADYRWIPNHTKTSRRRIGTGIFSKQDVRVPTLEKVLKEFPKTRMVIEMKKVTKAPVGYSPVQHLVELIELYEAHKRVLVASFEPKFMDAFRKALPTVATSLTISGEDTHRVLKQLLGSPGAAQGPVALQIPWEAFYLPLNEPILRKLQRRFAIHPWTVNKEWEMQKMISFGVDGIITDYPCTLLDALHRRPPQSRPCS